VSGIGAFSIAIGSNGSQCRQWLAHGRWLEARGFHMIQGTAAAALDLELGNRGDAGQQLAALATAKVDEHMTVILKRD
jgi:hypothetical protein